MGSERLGHMFTTKDPTFKGNASSSKKHDHHSMSHTSGTQPVSISNGPQSSSISSSSIQKAAKRLKPNSKYRKLLKLHSRQLSFIRTTIDAIESISKTMSVSEQTEFSLSKTRYNELNERIEDLRQSPTKQDHRAFDQIKDDIQNLVENLKLFKVNHQQSDHMNTLDLLMTIPIEESESDENDDNQNPSQLLNYF